MKLTSKLTKKTYKNKKIKKLSYKKKNNKEIIKFKKKRTKKITKKRTKKQKKNKKHKYILHGGLLVLILLAVGVKLSAGAQIGIGTVGTLIPIAMITGKVLKYKHNEKKVRNILHSLKNPLSDYLEILYLDEVDDEDYILKLKNFLIQFFYCDVAEFLNALPNNSDSLKLLILGYYTGVKNDLCIKAHDAARLSVYFLRNIRPKFCCNKHFTKTNVDYGSRDKALESLKKNGHKQRGSGFRARIKRLGNYLCSLNMTRWSLFNLVAIPYNKFKVLYNSLYDKNLVFAALKENASDMNYLVLLKLYRRACSYKFTNRKGVKDQFDNANKQFIKIDLLCNYLDEEKKVNFKFIKIKRFSKEKNPINKTYLPYFFTHEKTIGTYKIPDPDPATYSMIYDYNEINYKEQVSIYSKEYVEPINNDDDDFEDEDFGLEKDVMLGGEEDHDNFTTMSGGAEHKELSLDDGNEILTMPENPFIKIYSRLNNIFTKVQDLEQTYLSEVFFLHLHDDNLNDFLNLILNKDIKSISIVDKQILNIDKFNSYINTSYLSYMSGEHFKFIDDDDEGKRYELKTKFIELINNFKIEFYKTKTDEWDKNENFYKRELFNFISEKLNFKDCTECCKQILFILIKKLFFILDYKYNTYLLEILNKKRTILSRMSDFLKEKAPNPSSKKKNLNFDEISSVINYYDELLLIKDRLDKCTKHKDFINFVLPNQSFKEIVGNALRESFENTKYTRPINKKILVDKIEALNLKGTLTYDLKEKLEGVRMFGGGKKFKGGSATEVNSRISQNLLRNLSHKSQIDFNSQIQDLFNVTSIRKDIEAQDKDINPDINPEGNIYLNNKLHNFYDFETEIFNPIKTLLESKSVITKTQIEGLIMQIQKKKKLIQNIVNQSNGINII